VDSPAEESVAFAAAPQAAFLRAIAKLTAKIPRRRIVGPQRRRLLVDVDVRRPDVDNQELQRDGEDAVADRDDAIEREAPKVEPGAIRSTSSP
jgi:hypothetical protein